MPEGSEVVKRGNLKILEDYVGSKSQDKDLVKELLSSPKDPAQALTVDRQKKFYELYEDKDQKIHYRSKAGEKSYNNAEELRNLSTKLLNVNKDLAKEYGHKFYSEKDANSISMALASEISKLRRIAGTEQVKDGVRKIEDAEKLTGLSNTVNEKTRQEQVKNSQTPSKYADALEGFNLAINNVERIRQDLKNKPSYLYSNSINIEKKTPSRQDIMKNLSIMLQDQQRVTGIDHTKASDFKKLRELPPLKGEVLLEFKFGEKVTTLKIDEKSYRNLLKNVKQESLSKASDYNSVKSDDRPKLFENLGKDLEGSFKIKKGKIEVSLNKNLARQDGKALKHDADKQRKVDQDHKVLYISETPKNSKAEAVAAALRDQKKWTGIDASTPEGFKKLQQDLKPSAIKKDIDLVYHNQNLGGITNDKLSAKKFTILLKNVKQDTLVVKNEKGEYDNRSYSQLSKQAQEKLVANLRRDVPAIAD
ncbi:unnamed protein product, partial [Allacma fusca]